MNRRLPGKKPCCFNNGAEEIYRALQQQIEKLGLQREVAARKSGCLDRCEEGPTICIVDRGGGAEVSLLQGIRSFFSAGKTFRVRVQPRDAAAIVRELERKIQDREE
jgi:(2Fe-2S) ferredoxin